MNFFRLLTALILLSVSSVFSTESSKNTDSLKIFTTRGVNVSATNAQERESPVPFSEISATQIEKTKSNLDIPQMLNTQPSVISYSENGGWIGYSNLTLRGFDQRRIAVYVNGIPQNDPEDHNLYWLNYADLFESVGSVQIQRGAGVANYGAASIGGSINIETSLFAQKPSIKLYSGIGYQEFDALGETKFNSSKNMVEFSSGLVDNKYAFYGKISQTKSDGYRNGADVESNSYFLSAARYDKNNSTRINIYGNSQEDGLSFNGLPKVFAKNKNYRTSNLYRWQYNENYTKIIDSSIETMKIQEREKFNSPHFEILNDWQISDNISLKNSLFYFKGKGYYDLNGVDQWIGNTSFAQDQFTDTPEIIRNAIPRMWVDNNQIGYLPYLSWDHSNGKMMIGAEIRFSNADHWGNIVGGENLPKGMDSEFKFFSYESGKDMYSGFIREQYSLNSDIILSADIRFDYKKYYLKNEKKGNEFKSYLQTNGEVQSTKGTFLEEDYFFINPRFGINWNIDEEINIFSSFAITNREPRRADLYNPDFAFWGGQPQYEATLNGEGAYVFDFANPNVKPEQMLDIELGTRYSSGDYKAGVNFYYMSFQDEMLQGGGLDPYGVPVVGNAPKTTHLGVEIEASAKYNVFDYGNILFGANATLSKNTIDEYIYNFQDADTYLNYRANLSGNKISGFPDMMASFTLGYEISEFNFSITGKYVGEMFSDNFEDMTEAKNLDESLENAKIASLVNYNDNIIDAYFVMNSNISYRIIDFFDQTDIKIHIQINNLTNQFYIPYAVGGAYFPAAERSFYFGFELEL